MNKGLKELYTNIQKQLIGLVPEHWKSIYLYASVINGRNGEMYFYYYPKKFIRSNPINCYEVPEKFGLEDESYNRNLKKLYKYIKELNCYGFPRWTNLTISIKENTFTVEFRYNDILNSTYSDEQRRIIWCYKYLHIPLESLSLTDRALVETYNEKTEIKPTVYTEPLYIKPKNHTEEGKSEITQFENENIDDSTENDKIINQILKY